MGGGISYFNPDIGHNRILGETLWVDRVLGRSPLLRPIAIEFEARDVRWNLSSPAPSLRINTEQLGAVYTIAPLDNFHQYLKVSVGRGSANFAPSGPTWRAASLAGGLTLRVHRRIWLRGEYEYQIFPDFFPALISRTSKAAALDPQGLTFGVMYTIGREKKTE